MSQRLWWRLWLYRLGRTYERWLKLATGAGFGGLLLTVLLRSVAPTVGQDWQMIFMGCSLILAGAGHALLGEGVSLERYANGESEEMPTIGKLVSGLVASGSGAMLAVTGLVHLLA